LSIFSDLHYSIISGRFYTTVLERSAGEILRFVALVCLLTALVSGAAHTYYSFDRKTGIAAQVAGLIGGMEFKDGSLDPHAVVPRFPAVESVEKLLNTLLGVPRFFSDLPDSIFIIDTAASALSRKSPRTQILLGKRSLYVNPGTPVSFTIPYSFVAKEGTLVVTEESVRSWLMGHITEVAINFIVETGLVNTLVFLLSIAFLTFAAYIFRLERERKFGEFLALACFAASPVYVGTNLVALSGTTFFWTWHVMILFATFVMFRGVMASRRDTDRPINND